jgi:hypothetical protein
MLLYIASAILVVLILIFGFKALTSFKAKQRAATIIELEASLKSAVESVSDDFGSVREVEIRVPAGTDQICFLDLSKRSYLLKTSLMKKFPGINESVGNMLPENMFLIDGKRVTDSRFVGSLCFPRPYYRCIDTPTTLVRLLIMGKKACADIIKPLSSLLVVNLKNLSKYEGNPIFLTEAPFDWQGKQNNIRVIPIAVSSDLEGEMEVYPYYVYYEQGLNQPADEFLVDYLLSKHSSSEMRFFSNTGIPASLGLDPRVTGEPYSNYFSYWENMQDVVIIDTAADHPGALIGSLFASYLAAPLIFVDDVNLGQYDEYLNGSTVYVVDSVDPGVTAYINNNAKVVIEYPNSILRTDPELNPYRELVSHVIPSIYIN